MPKRNWTLIKHESELPNDGKEYWVTYCDFYGEKHLGKGKRNGHISWQVGPGLSIGLAWVIAVMPYEEPQIFDEKSATDFTCSDGEMIASISAMETELYHYAYSINSNGLRYFSWENLSRAHSCLQRIRENFEEKNLEWQK